MKNNLPDILESIDTVSHFMLPNAVIDVLKLCKSYMIYQSDQINLLECEIDLILDEAKNNPDKLVDMLQANFPEKFYGKPN